MTNVLSKSIDHSFQNAIRMIQNDTSLPADAETTFDDIIQEMDRNHVKICLKIYQTQEKIPTNCFESC